MAASETPTVPMFAPIHHVQRQPLTNMKMANVVAIVSRVLRLEEEEAKTSVPVAAFSSSI